MVDRFSNLKKINIFLFNGILKELKTQPLFDLLSTNALERTLAADTLFDALEDSDVDACAAKLKELKALA